MLNALYVFLPCIVAGIIQATTGFGSGIFVMLFFPMFLPILKSSALSTLVSAYACISLAWKHRKNANPKIVIMPAIFYFAASFLAIRFATGADMDGLKAFFGLFLIIIAIWFMFFADKVKLKPNLMTAAVCGTVSGIASGLFGIGGPPMVIYILAVVGDDKEAYIANSQFFFSMTCLYTTALRIFNGILTIDLLPLVIPGMLGMFIGKTVGSKIVEKIDILFMKKLIYGFLGLSGLLTFVTNI
ncbi:MAG: sulfite exporter TauE/SafE family protein [Clostridia bacterium]|nr:sulfite exporter TauE/SafE family protein [Clostridia bacterium]